MSETPQQPINPLDALEEIDAFQRRQQAAQIQEWYQRIVVEAPVTRIPEHVFVNEILPFICGEAPPQVNPAVWASVAATPLAEIDVIDKQGQVIFRMPPLMDREAFSHAEASKTGSVSNTLENISMLRHQSPVRAKALMVNSLATLGIRKDLSDVVKRGRARWQAIFDRYGKTFPGAEPTNKNAAAAGGGSSKDRPPMDFSDHDLL